MESCGSEAVDALDALPRRHAEVLTHPVDHQGHLVKSSASSNSTMVWRAFPAPK